jgi:hypothetical protein
MASKAPRFQRTLNRTRARIDPFAGAAESELAGELEGFAARRSAELDKRASEEGFLAGTQAGEGEESARTIRGRAFNRGVLASQQAAQQTDLRDNIERIELEHENDPEAFDQKVAGLLEGLLEEADPQLQPFIKQRAADYSGRAKTRIIARQQAELEKQALADLDRGIEGLIEDATTAAFEGGDLGVLMIETRHQELNELLGEGIDGELVDEGAAIAQMEAFERQVTMQEVIGNTDRLIRDKGLEAGQAAIDRWEKLKPSSVGLTVDDHMAVRRQLEILHNREKSDRADEGARAAAGVRAETNLRRDRVTDAISVMRDGFAPDKQQAEQVAEDLAFLTATGDPEDLQQANKLAGDFDVANAIQGEVHRFRRLPGVVRDSELNRLEDALRSGGASSDEVDLLQALKKTNGDINRELDTDPRGYLQREGLVEDAALDFSGAEELAASIAARDTDAGSQLAGQPIGKLTAAEADQFAQIYHQAEIEEKAALLGVITAGSGEDAEATLEQIDAKGYQNMALLGSYVMEGRGMLAREVMRGQLLLASTPAMKPAVEQGFRSQIDDAWGGAMADWPEQRAIFRDAAFAKYAELKSRTGDLTDIYQPNLMTDALEAVMPTARFNGRRVAVPAGITEDRFEDWTENWNPETFAQPVGITPDIAPLVAHGQANAAAGTTVTDKGGKHSIFSMGVQDSRLNGGRETIIPTVYDGKIVSRKEAVQRALDSGIEWPSADTVEEATEIAKRASEAMDQFDEQGRPTMAVPGVTAEEMLELVQDDGRLVELGNGRYGVSIVSAASGLGRILTEDDGTPFMLQFPRPAQ